MKPNPDYEAIIYGRINEVAQTAKSTGAHFLCLLCPDKHGIYFDYLPRYLTYNGHMQRTDKLVQRIRDSGISCLFPFEDLCKNRKNWQLYFKTDTHWTPRGAFLAYSRLCRELKNDFALQVPDFSFTPQELHEADLTSIGGYWG